jgi:UDP-glucose 4-epimerase
MKILITGGFGYIGSRIAQHLAKIYGDENILLFVKNNRNEPGWVGRKKFFAGDVLDISSLKAAFKNVDVIIHLAALNEIDSGTNPLQALRINGEGTLNLINAAIANRVKRIIYFSTFHVYGLNAFGDITENTVPMPVHPYAITHHVAEDFIRMADNRKEIEGIILRLSNGFGYPAHPQVNRWSLVVRQF